jgi:hypothetical protein
MVSLTFDMKYPHQPIQFGIDLPVDARRTAGGRVRSHKRITGSNPKPMQQNRLTRKG